MTSILIVAGEAGVIGQWVKRIVDTYYSLKNREAWRYEELARLAEARTRIARLMQSEREHYTKK